MKRLLAILLSLAMTMPANATDLFVDVDTAVTVPVNLHTLTDSTDFVSRETAVAYDAAGMDLVWNFVTSAGVITQTAVTPTTSGVYDWSHVGDGIYKIEIPASGGGSINNDTEGYGWFSGVATGVLPWRGPVVCFRASGLNDKLTDSAYDATRGLSGTALPAAAAEAAGGLFTRGTGAGQINQAANGMIDVNLARWLNTAPLALSAQRVQVDVMAIDGAEAAAENMNSVFNTEFSISWDAARSVWNANAQYIDDDATSASGTVTFANGTVSILDAAGVRTAVGLASANLDTQLTAIDDLIDTEVAAIKTKTDFLPSATAGAAGGVFIAGTNAAVTIANASGAGLTITGGGAAGIGVDIAGAGLGPGVRIRSGAGSAATGLEITSLATNGSAVALTGVGSGHGLLLDGGATGDDLNLAADDAPDLATVMFTNNSGSSYAAAHANSVVKQIADNSSGGGGATVQEIVDGLLDELLAGHQDAGSVGKGISDAQSAGNPWSALRADNNAAGSMGETMNDIDDAPTFTEVMDDQGYTEARAEFLDDLQGGGVVPTDLDDETIPRQRTWKLVLGDGGLGSDQVLTLRIGPSPTFAVDFENDIPPGEKIHTVDSVAIASGTAGGITFGTNGKEDSQAKFRITGVTAGVYTIRVTVHYSSGATQAGVVTLRVVQ